MQGHLNLFIESPETKTTIAGDFADRTIVILDDDFKFAFSSTSQEAKSASSLEFLKKKDLI